METIKNNYLIKKIKGIFFNHNGKYNKNFVDSTIKIFRKLNCVSMGITHQSIHHINYNSNKDGTIEKIVINFRKMGVKPEDIDGFMLEKKKEKEGLNNYEQLIYGIWKYHYDTNPNTMESKMINVIAQELHILKNKWTENNTETYGNMSEEYREELKLECENIIKKITKYETS